MTGCPLSFLPLRLRGSPSGKWGLMREAGCSGGGGEAVLPMEEEGSPDRPEVRGALERDTSMSLHSWGSEETFPDLGLAPRASLGLP